MLVAVTKVYHGLKTQIPAEIARRFQLKEGERVAWFVEGDRVYIEPARRTASRSRTTSGI